jgi:hypothetical protein
VQICGPQKWPVLQLESSLRQPGVCGLEVPARARTVAARLGEAGAGTGVRKRAWFSGPEKGWFWCSRVFHAVRVGGESADGSSAGSRTTAPSLSVGSVGGLRCAALLCAVSCESVFSTQVGPTVYGA